MTPQELAKKRIGFFSLLIYFLVGYFLCNTFNMHRSYYFDVALPFEKGIPFISAFIVGYMAVYIALLLVYVEVYDYLVFKKVLIFFFTITTIHFIFFILIPVKMARPDLSTVTDFMGIFTRRYFVFDNPVNCFPSLHVSYPLSGTLILWNYKRKWALVLAALTVIVAVSVVLIKQHYIMDVAGAIVVTSLTYLCLKKFL